MPQNMEQFNLSLEGRVFDGTFSENLGGSQKFELQILKVFPGALEFVGSCTDPLGNAGVIGEIFPSLEIRFLKKYIGREARANGIAAQVQYQGVFFIVGEKVSAHGNYTLPAGYNDAYNGTWEMTLRE